MNLRRRAARLELAMLGFARVVMNQGGAESTLGEGVPAPCKLVELRGWLDGVSDSAQRIEEIRRVYRILASALTCA